MQIQTVGQIRRREFQLGLLRLNALCPSGRLRDKGGVGHRLCCGVGLLVPRVDCPSAHDRLSCCICMHSASWISPIVHSRELGVIGRKGGGEGEGGGRSMITPALFTEGCEM